MYRKEVKNFSSNIGVYNRKGFFLHLHVRSALIYDHNITAICIASVVKEY
jgi:hypothetical protein